jgi:hypothetical protein
MSDKLTREEKCKLAIEKGIRYEPETGNVLGIKGGIITTKKTGYVVIEIVYNGKMYPLFAHQFAWYVTNKEVVDCIDHINGDRCDNRIDNLRSVTRQQNQFNMNNVKGYCKYHKSNKWRAYIKLNKKQIHLGLFNSEEEARKAYVDAKKVYHVFNE